MFYRTCPDCGANLDPGERCDCRKEKEPSEMRQTLRTATQNRDDENLTELFSVYQNGRGIAIWS